MATVLYVDDEELACKYFARAVGGAWRVLTATGVDAALDVLRAEPVDVLVTDYRMPGRAGSELLHAAGQDYPELVCILVTAYADKALLLETVNGGAVFRVLEKPLQQDTLRTVLRLAAEEAQRRARELAARRHAALAVEETVAFLAHELGAPLSAIAGFAGTIARRALREDDVDDEAANALPLKAHVGNAAAHMDEHARYCLSVLASFVDAVKRASPVPAARVAECGAHRMATALLAGYPLSSAQRAAIAVDVQHDFAIRMAPNCVALVLSALLDNALSALHGSASPLLRVTVGAGMRPVIVVEDNGIGIEPAILHRLLLEPVSLHGGAGHGWGLIFCNRVMQSFGGHLRVQSTQGEGTTVTMHFPESLNAEKNAANNAAKPGPAEVPAEQMPVKETL